MGLGTGRENDETNEAAIPTRDEQRGSPQLSGKHVLPCIPVPFDSEDIRLAANLPVFHVTLPHPHGSIHQRLVPLSAASALKA